MKIAYMVVNDAKTPMGLFSDQDSAVRYATEKAHKIAAEYNGIVSVIKPPLDNIVAIYKMTCGSWLTRQEWSCAVVKIVLDLNSDL